MVEVVTIKGGVLVSPKVNPALDVGIPKITPVVDSVNELTGAYEVDPGSTGDVTSIIREVLLSRAIDVVPVWLGLDSTAVV